MELLVKRLRFSDKATIGEMFIDGAQFCFTLEDKVRPAGVKIAHQTAIPAGTYSVVIGHSNRFNRDMPRVQDVPNFEGILIHYGNTDKDTDGCILVGATSSGDDFIGGSRDTFAKLFDKLKGAVGPITLTVTNEPEVDTRSQG